MNKNFFNCFSLSAAVAAMATTALASPQDQNPPPPPPAAVEPPPPPPLPVAPQIPDLKPMLEDVRRQVEIVREQAAHAVDAAGDFFAPLTAGDANFMIRPGARPPRSLVISLSDLDAPAITAAEEDLNIMARILDKALPGRDGNKAERSAMGIAILSAPGSGGAIRNLYLEGYGAVFFLDVRFPLLPPPKKDDQNEPKQPTSSAWEEARSEVRKSRTPRGERVFTWRNSSRGEVEEYDADKVERLKESLLDALQHATHVRNVKPNESVTIVVNGVVNGGDPSPAGRVSVMKAVTAGDGKSGRGPKFETDVWSSDDKQSAGSRGTTMILRAQKSDVDAFAQGKLDLEQFKKKATVRVYGSGG